MSKKKLLNRIDSLFAELQDEATAIPMAAQAEAAIPDALPERRAAPELKPNGWTWACDQDGNYRECSPEVEEVLGYPPQVFSGKSIKEFCITKGSAEVLKSRMQSLDLPIEVSLEFITSTGDKLPVRIYIIASPHQENGSEEKGWRGYAQTLTPVPTRMPSQPPAKREKKPVTPRKPATESRGKSSPLPAVRRSAPKITLPGETSGIMAIPFETQTAEAGLIEIVDDEPGRVWTEDERRLVEQVADQLSLALENAQLFQQTQNALTETRTLYDIASATTRTLDLTQTLEELLDRVLASMESQGGLISIAEKASGLLSVVVSRNLPPQILQAAAKSNLKGSICEYVFQHGEALTIPDFEREELIPGDFPEINSLLRSGFHSYLGVPLISKGKVLGTVCTFSEAAREVDESRISLLRVAGQQIGIAVENAQLYEETQARADELVVLNEMGRALASSLNVEAVAEATYTYVRKLMQAPNFFIAIYDPVHNEIELPVAYALNERIYSEKTKLGAGLTDYIIRNRESLLLNGSDIPQQMARLGIEFVPLGDDVPPVSWLGVPILYGDEILGVISLQSTAEPFLYTENDRNVLGAIASQAAIAFQNARLYQEEQHRRQVADTLREIATVVSSTLDLGEASRRMLQNLSKLIDFKVASIQLIQQGQRRQAGLLERDPLSSDVQPVEQLPAEEAWLPVGDDPRIVETLRRQSVLLIEDAVLDPLWENKLEDAQARSWLGAPLMVSKEVVGLLTMEHELPNAFSSEAVDLVDAVAAQVAVAIQNASLFQQTQTALGETAGLYQASAEINTAQSFADIVDVLRRHSIAGKDAHHTILCYFDQPWTPQAIPEWVDVLARWTDHPGEEFPTRFPLQAYPSLVDLLSAAQILQLDNISSDPRLDETTRDVYSKLFGAVSALFVPLVVGRDWIGFININYPQTTSFAERELRRLSALAGQAAVAIQNLRSVAIAQQRAFEASQRSNELALVNRVVSAMVSSPDLRLVLDAVAGELINAFHLAHASIALLNEDQSTLTVVAEKSSLGDASAEGMRFAVKGNQAIEGVLKTRQSMMITRVQTSPLVAPMQVLLHERGIQSMAFFPILVSGGMIGTISLDTVEKERVFTPQELTLAETLVGQISTSIQNANLYDQTQRALRETEVLYQASAELSLAASFLDVLDILRKYTVLGDANASQVLLNFFDHAWVEDDIPGSFTPFARWTTESFANTQPLSYPYDSWKTIRSLFKPDAVVMVEDVTKDDAASDLEKSVFIIQLSARSLIFAPLYAAGEWVGHIIGIYATPMTFLDQDVRILLSLSRQAAVTVQNLRLLEETRRRAGQLGTAAEIARDTSGTLALEKLLDRAVNLVRERYGFYHSSIFLLDDAHQFAVVHASTGLAGEEMLRGGHKLAVGSPSMIGYVTETGEALVANDVHIAPTHHVNPLLPDTKAELAIPMKIGEDIIGALDVQATKVDAFSPDDVSVLQIVADQIAVAVDNARSYERAQQAIQETHQRVQELSTLFDLSRSLSAIALEPHYIASIVSRTFMETFGASEVTFSLLDKSEGKLVILDSLAVDAKTQALVQTSEVDQSYSLDDYPATRKVVQSNQPMTIRLMDTQPDPAEAQYMLERDARSMVILPLAVKGEALGTIEIKFKVEDHNLSKEELNLAQTLANSAATSLENALLYEEQRETAEQLRELDKLKTQFLANMSHELRTPLNSIIGFSRVILKGIDGPISEVQKTDLTAINSAGQHLLQLINDVLDISKIEAGRMELAFDDHVNLVDVITSAMPTAIGLTRDRPINLIKDVPDNLPTVRADSTRIRQVLINFLSNAAKFTEQGSITVKAEVTPNPEGQPEVMISVIDTGIGISKEDQAKLFQPFSQVDTAPTRRVGGSGLGLSISRLLIDLHGGRIGVESELDKGSRFYFTIPLTPEKEETYSLPVTTQPVSTKIVLGIDDDRQVLGLYQRYLSDHGYQVLPLTDPTKAIETVRQVKPFAITLDVMMPGKDGWEVLEELKSDPSTRSVPVIVCSIVEDQEKAFSLGAVGYLTKPILDEDLIQALDSLNGEGQIQEVLVVDDDDNDLRLVEKILTEKGGYRVRLAHGGTEGLVAMHRSPPQAIVLDLFMPDLDGFTLLENAHADPDLAQIPVVILTGGDISSEQRQRLQAFSHLMLQKSTLSEEELLASIESVLKKLKNVDANPARGN